METKTKTYDKEPEPAPLAAPKHKLAEEWTVTLVGAQSTADGKMDLRTMTPQGHLANGKHVHDPENVPPTFVEDITGDAVSVTLPNGQETFSITLRTLDNSATYTGVLLRDNGNELGIGGFFKFRAPTRPGPSGAPPAQDEGVWIVTKP